MSVSSYRFIDPKALAAVGDLELVARRVVDGFMYGVHPSRVPGPGLEFSQYRSYQPGDDLRRVDWKLFGRSDRYFIRESEIETSLTVRLVLDASASMAHAEGGLSKFDYARFLAASLAVLASRQGDATGLSVVRDGGLDVMAPDRSHQQLHRILHRLERLTPTGRWPDWNTLELLFAAVGATRGLTVLITDLHEHGAELRTAAEKLASLGHDVIVLHIVGRREAEFDYTGPLVFEELETGRQIEVDADRARAAYLEEWDREHRAIRQELAERRVSYGRFVLDEPLDAALRHYLTARARGA